MSPDQHLFTVLGRRFLLDVPTCSILAIDEEAYAALSGSGPMTDEVSAEVDGLRAQGLLLPDPLRLDPPAPASPGPLKALCFHAAHDCNLRCQYCFGSGGNFGGTRSLMPLEVGRRAIDLLLVESGFTRTLEVDFFGGEPLLALDTVRDSVAYGRERAASLGKTINYTLTTNGVLLDGEALAFLNEADVSLILSLDGRPEVHDRFRHRIDGRGSYGRVAEKIVAAAASRGGENYYARGTYTRFNTDFTEDVRHFLDLGLTRFSLEPVVAAAELPYALREQDLPRVEEEYEDLARLYLDRALAEKPFVFYHFEVELNGGPCLPRRLTGCGAGHRYLAVTPEGTLYPCHQLVGKKEYILGDVERGVVRSDLAERFAAADIFRKHGCAECWARYYCSGGCHANALLQNGDPLQPDAVGCRLMRKRLECALGVKAILAERECGGSL